MPLVFVQLLQAMLLTRPLAGLGLPQQRPQMAEGVGLPSQSRPMGWMAQ